MFMRSVRGVWVMLMLMGLAPAVPAAPQPAAEAGATSATLPPKLTAAELARLPRARVVRVIDGDTVDLELAGRAVRCRLFGLDTPETQERIDPYGPEAALFLKNLLAGEEVWVAANATGPARDQYGRMLGFLFRVPDGLYVNLEIVRQGYGRVFDKDPFPHLKAFRESEGRARAAGKGMWAKASAASADPAKPAPVPRKQSAAPDAQPAPPAAQGEPVVYVTKSGTKYHRADCSSLSKSKIAMPLSEAKRRGFTPCARCKPPQ